MTVHICELPAIRDLAKTGIDDFLAHPEGGPAKALALIEAARRFTPPTAHDLMVESGIDTWTAKPDQRTVQDAFQYLREESKNLDGVATELLRDELATKLRDLGYARAARVADAALNSQNGSGNPSALTATLQHLPASPISATELEVLHDRCRALSREPDILHRIVDVMRRFSIAGEDRPIKLSYLVITARVLDRPVSLIIKGPSSVGKSYPLQTLLKLFPPSAYYALTGMSEHGLVYLTEPMAHRTLIVYEATGFESDAQSYFLRTLLSEGRLSYATAEKGEDGTIRSRRIDLEGPTGLITTTTAVNLHPENETRALSVLANDSPEQTKAVMLAQAREPADQPDTAEFVALQEWLASAEHRVTIPYAERLVNLIPPVAVRLRRDVPTVLGLIRAHAVLHQATRERDSSGHIVATLEDYEQVRQLVSDAISTQVDATVADNVRETVDAVRRLQSQANQPVSISDLKDELKLDKSTISRRVKVALKSDYLQNEETHRGRPYRLIPGEPLPSRTEILPTVDMLQPGADRCRDACNGYPTQSKEDGQKCCSVAAQTEGIADLARTSERTDPERASPSPTDNNPPSGPVPEPTGDWMAGPRLFFKAKRAQAKREEGARGGSHMMTAAHHLTVELTRAGSTCRYCPERSATALRKVPRPLT